MAEHFELGDARLLAMEGLRAFAVLLVFLQHYSVQLITYFTPSGFLRDAAVAIRSYGNVGVELFFVLSGYLIYGALIRRPSFVKFMRRRMQRIYPAYLVVLGCCVAVELLMGTGPIPHEAWPATAYLFANLLLLPGLFPIDPVFTVAWTLSYEMFFYFAVSALVVTAHLDRCSRTVRVGVILFLAMLLLTTAAAGVPYTPYRMLPFFAGMLLFEVGDLKTTQALTALGLLAPFTAFLAKPVLHLPVFDSYLAAELLYTTTFFLLCFACFRTGNMAYRLFSWAPLRWLGNISYSYYLTHGFAVTACMVLAAKFTSHLTMSFAVPVFAATLLPSTILYLWIEKPYSLDVKKRRSAVVIVPRRIEDEPHQAAADANGEDHTEDEEEPTSAAHGHA